MKGSRLFTLATVAGLLVAACGTPATPVPSTVPASAAPGGASPAPAGSSAASSAAPSSSAAGGVPNPGTIGGKLVIDNESGGTWSCQFNPYNSAVSLTSVGFVYEPLEFVDALQTNADGSNKLTPWLAADSSWSPDFKTLTFTIRRRRQVERRPAIQRPGRALHVQRPQGRPGARPERPVAGRRRTADRRRRAGREPGRVHVQWPGRDVLLLRRRPDPDPARSTSGGASTRRSSTPSPTTIRSGPART